MKHRLRVVAILVLLAFSAIIQLTTAKKGTGELYVYFDDKYTMLIPKDEHDMYPIFPGQTIYIQIWNITEFEDGDLVDVKISWGVTVFEDQIVKYLAVGILGVGDPSAPIEWVVPDIPYCQTVTVHYKNASKPAGPDYVSTIYDADGRMISAHLHSVPEIPVGSIGPVMILAASYTIYSIRRKLRKD